MPVEVRFDDKRTPAEIVGKEVTFHLERLSGTSFCLVIESAGSRSQFSIRSKGRVELSIVEVNMRESSAAAVSAQHPTFSERHPCSKS